MASRQKSFSMSDETYSKTVTMLINKYSEAHAFEIEKVKSRTAELRKELGL